MTNPGICGQCDSMNRSCCTLRVEDNDGLPAPVSDLETARILKVLGNKKKDDFLDCRINTPQFIRQISILFPGMTASVYKAFPLNGTHFELKTQKDACIFKTPGGCQLPDEARPLFCRIYPFWFFDDEPHLFQDSNCLALETCQTISEIFLSLGTKPEKLQQIHSKICQDWGLYRSMPHTKKKTFSN